MEQRIDAGHLAAVVGRASVHDPDAWEQLYRHSRPRLFRYARRRLPSDHLADDAVSEVMVRAMDRIEQFTWQGAGFDAWMYGITRNVVLEMQRRSARTVSTANDEAASDGDVIDLRAESLVSDSIEAREEADLLRRSFERLSDSDREVLELRVLGELSSDDVAAVLGRKPGTIRMAQSRALERLRSAMRELDNV